MASDSERDAAGPSDFLAALTKDLKADKEADADLANILGAHILKVDPSQSCVAEAKAAIETLAKKRAQPKPEQADG